MQPSEVLVIAPHDEDRTRELPPHPTQVQRTFTVGAEEPAEVRLRRVHLQVAPTGLIHPRRVRIGEVANLDDEVEPSAGALLPADHRRQRMKDAAVHVTDEPDEHAHLPSRCAGLYELPKRVRLGLGSERSGLKQRRPTSS